jgi:hypothetical protein
MSVADIRNTRIGSKTVAEWLEQMAKSKAAIEESRGDLQRRYDEFKEKQADELSPCSPGHCCDSAMDT